LSCGYTTSVMRSFLLFLLVVTTTANDRELRLRQDGTFKIVQFADLHFGETLEVSGPQQDLNSTRVMKNILEFEEPDLVVFTGDQITGNDIDYNSTIYWSQVVRPCYQGGFHWAVVFGNHDDMAFGDGGTRRDLISLDISYALSFSQQGPPSLYGTTNYYLPILPYRPDQNIPVSVLYFFDSGGGQLPEAIQGHQVEWYVSMSKALRQKANDQVLPSIAFFHIPLEEYNSSQKTNCFGQADDGVTPVAESNGLFNAFQKMGDVKATFVGHDHGNDWCCLYEGIRLCFGRHTGYGGYGTWDRGARVIQLSQGRGGVLEAKTWVRMEDGTILEGSSGPVF
jgi:hypothetical protein